MSGCAHESSQVSEKATTSDINCHTFITIPGKLSCFVCSLYNLKSAISLFDMPELRSEGNLEFEVHYRSHAHTHISMQKQNS